jgi:hypothetical protein
MDALRALIDRTFDLFFRPFRDIHPAYGLSAASFVTGVMAMLVFRYASNQPAMRRAKSRIQAHILELRLFPDQPGVVMRAYGRVLRFTGAYLVHALRPLLILLLPVAVIMGQLDLRFSHRPLRPDELFIVKAEFADPLAVDSSSLAVPRGLTLTAPPVHIPALQEVDWRLRADGYGEFLPAVIVAGHAFPKRVVVSNGLVRLAVRRAQAHLWERLLDPGEEPMPAGSAVRAIEVGYKPRIIDLGRFQTGWLGFFLVASLVSGWLMKVILRIEL